MSRTRSRSLAPLLVVPLLLGSGLLAGCGVSSDDKPSGTSSASTTPEASASESATPTQSVSPSPTPTPTPSPTPTADPSPSLTPEEALLTATEVPPLNDALRWKQGRTGPVSSAAFGVCAKFDVLSIGAEQAVERAFTAGSDAAGQQVATFPDATTTGRATKVLEAFHKTCAARVPGTKVKVGAIASVPVSQGTAWWYLVSYVDHGTGHFHAFGVDVVGNRISLISMDHVGQDHDYPAGQDPMQLAVKAAARKLG